MRNQVFKKLFSVLLALIMVAGLLPASAMAGGWGAMDVDTTPELTETEQPTESAEPTKPAETETPEVTEVPEPTPENPAATDESTQGEPTAEPTDEGIMPANVMPVQAATTDDMYIKKEGNGKRLEDETFYRIFLLDCGRKYFTFDEIKGIIDLLKANHYTHIELAFGNEGLRLLLNEKDTLSFKNNGVVVEKTGTQINEAIQYGNDQLDNVAGYKPGEKEEFTQAEMSDIIAYAKGQGIGVIPLFNAPGHMYTVVKAMEKLELNANSITVENAGGGKTANVAIDPTNANAVYFVQALMQKYVDYFRDEGCKFFNIGADESGINKSNYSAYAMLVNSHAAMVQNAGMIPMAFNDGIYNPNYISYLNGVEFDSNIVISYWTYSKLATAKELADKKFIINSTHNNWYYVLGNDNNEYFGYNSAINNMNTVKCNSVDSGYTTKNGCTLAVWCDYPGRSYDTSRSNVASLISTFATQNPNYFKAEEVKVPAVEISEEKTVREVRKSEQSEGTYEVVLYKESSTLQTLKLTVANGAEGATYTWTSNNEDVATVKNGLVTFKGAEGTVTITATPVPATRSNTETAAYSITLNVEVEGDVEVTEKKTVIVTVGSTAKENITGKNYAGDYNTENPEIATVTVTGTNATEGEPKYNSTSVTYSALASNNTSWTKTDYYYKPRNSNNYYPVYAYVKSEVWYGTTYYIYYYGYLENDSSNSVTEISNSYYGSNTVSVYEKVDGTVPASTTVIFEGKAVGETTVVVGHVKYTIKVTKEDLSNAKDFYIQLWFTNVTIESENTSVTTSNWTGRTAKYITVKAGNAYGENGVPLSQLVPTSMTRYEYDGTYWIAEQSGKDAAELIYLKGKALNGTSQHQYVWSTDRCNDSETGIEFQYVRYYKGIWQVSNDRTNWSDSITAIQNDPSESNSYQVVAYYTMRTKVVDEIYTDITEWPTLPHTKLTGGYCLLDYRVVYTSGLTVPSTFPADKKTMSFACGNGVQNSSYDSTVGAYYRKLNQIDATAIQGYEIYMVTLTPTSDTATVTVADSASGATSYEYSGTEKVVWVDDEANLPTKFQSDDRKYTSSPSGNATTYHIGGTPNLESVEIYEKQGLLVTYYIRPVVTNDTLTVHYRIDGTNFEFHYYNIGVKSGVTFREGIKLNNPWKGNLYDGDVPSLGGKTEWVSSDLYTMPQIDAVYRFANYECVRVERSKDGKDVYLYYKFNYTKTFVVDFGLQLIITPESVSESLAGANIEKVVATYESEYADVEVSGKNVIYRLKTLINGSDQVVIEYSGTNLENGNAEGKITFNIQVIPATNVYYEDSFAKFYDSDGKQQTQFNATGTDDTPGVWYIDGQEKTATQALEALGEKTNHNVYGYDPAYQDSTMFSMGSARKVTVTSDMATNWNNDTSAWPTAQFTFKGTGFDIISLTDNTSGAIFVDVYKGNSNSGEKEKGHVVNNYYGYTYSEGNGWEINNNPNAIYQVPVIKVSGLTYGEHTVVIKVCYDKIFDVADGKKYSFWLDAVRVYDPAGNTLDNDYVKDSEVKPIYVEVRKALIEKNNFTADTTVLANGAVFIDGKSTGASIDDYKNFGPNHEVYLAKDQAIAFRIVADMEPVTVQIGVKLANGSSGTLKISGNNVVKFAAYSDVDANDTLTLNTATDMYYALNGITWTVENGSQKSNVIVLTNTGENSIVSITNVKCTYANAEESTANTVALAISYDDALMAVDMVNNAITPIEPEPEPEKTFEPERFEASWSRNVMQGRKATLTVKTSEDVEAITVDGQTIRSYRTRTERMGFGRRAKRITYREFTYSMVAQESADFSVTAINAEGTESEAITARLTVKTRPNSMRDMWDWFKGWF